jgi:hypothetical protein
MTTTQPEALFIAERLEHGYTTKYTTAIAAIELRRQHDLLIEQQHTIEVLNSCIGGAGSTTTENVTRIDNLENLLGDFEEANEALRNRLEVQKVENRAIRRMLCAVKAPRAYMDDGEASDASAHPIIDYLRDSPDLIQTKWTQRWTASQENSNE